MKVLVYMSEYGHVGAINVENFDRMFVWELIFGDKCEMEFSDTRDNEGLYNYSFIQLAALPFEEYMNVLYDYVQSRGLPAIVEVI
jgi:hypothetical protein